MIKVENLEFGYKNSPSLFKNLTFEAVKGQTLAILGPNGVGKTSLLKCLLGFMQPKTGRVYLKIDEEHSPKSKVFWQKVSYVPQSKPLNFAYTAMEMVLLGRAGSIGFGQKPSPMDISFAEEAMDTVGVLHLKDRYCHQMSGGELQLVLIARAIVSHPEVLVLDEPESSLDMKNQLAILNIIEHLKQEHNMTTILNTHYPNHAIRLAETSLVMGYGGKFDIGSTVELITEDTIRKYFDVDSTFFELDDNQSAVHNQKKVFFAHKISDLAENSEEIS